MDAILKLATIIVFYTSLLAQGVAVGGAVLLGFIVLMMFNNPEVTAVTCLLMAYVISWYSFKTVRRFLRWYLFWPIGRAIHRLFRRPVRRIVGGLMARWKKFVVANRIDDLLMDLCYEEHLISKTDYLRMSNAIGQAIGCEDLVSRKRGSKGIKKRVLENIGVMKLTPQVPGPPRKVKADPSYNPTTGKVVHLAFLRRRNSAA